MTKRGRIIAYGSAGLLVVAGGVCVAAVGGETGQVLATALIGCGLVALVGLVFMEVGLSEDREREREQRARQRAAQPRHPDQPWRRPLERMRGRQRRLR